MVNALIFAMILQSSVVRWEADDRKTIPEPQAREISPTYDFITGTFLEPMAQVADVPRNFRKLFHRNKEAENLNSLDEVPNSSWFTNRNFMRPLLPEEITRGPNSKQGPARGSWTVEQCKIGGISPGIQIQDSEGDSYLLKFDPPEFPEMSTSADVVGSKLLYAAGYNVPGNSVVVFDPKALRIKPGVQCRDEAGANAALDQDFIAQLLATVAHQKDGRVRAVASKFLDGKPKGPFSYLGWRNDDPNDVIAHEHRRELRGLRVLASFFNHSDVKQLNTLDMFVEEDGRKFLKHYLIDFGASLGSATRSTKQASQGHEYTFDTSEILKNVGSLGMRRRIDEVVVQPIHPAIGYLEGENDFEPAKWKPNIPSPAFENMTDRDAYWGAKIVASFTDDQIRAAIAAGQYSDPEAQNILFEILRQRRDKIARYWFRRVVPLDRFRVQGDQLVFDDLAVRGGYDTTGDTSYRATWRIGKKTQSVRVAPGASIPLPSWDQTSGIVSIQIARASTGWPEQRVTVRLARNNGKVEVVGVER